MATDRLKIYNGALLLCSERALASLSEDRQPRYLLDLVWNDNGVRFCLEQAQWHFAMRASRLGYNPSISPDWGFSRAFDKPTDWISTSGIWQDEFLTTPLLQYADEVGFWFSDLDTIYVKYVSDDVTFGADYSKWPASFTDYVKAYFAGRIVYGLSGAAEKVGLIKHPQTGIEARALTNAKNRAAMTQAATFPTRGTWARARHAGQRSGWHDGGSQTRLIG